MPQELWDDELAENVIDFSDEEDYNDPSLIKDAHKYLQEPQKMGKGKKFERSTHIKHKPLSDRDIKNSKVYMTK